MLVSPSPSIAVIGGGAAGFFAAIAAAESSNSAVSLYEAGPEPLAKVRISGGGRCNVTHHCFDPAQLVQHYPRGGRALRGAFSRFQPKDTVAWFTQRGVRLKTEPDGRMFPVTDTSETIVDCLTQAARSVGVQLKTRSPLKSAERITDGFKLRFRTGEVTCDRLLLATGSSPIGHRVAQSLGHTVTAPVPSLFTLNIADPLLHQLSGVAIETVDLKLKLEGAKPLSQTGPLLITHWGLSGPAVLKLSAWGARALHQQRYRGQVQIGWLPAMTQDQVRQQLLAIKGDWAKRAIAPHNPFPLPKRLWQYLTQRAGLDPTLTWANLSKKALHQLVLELSQGQYDIGGKGIFKEEFVTCGGVQLKEVNFQTMESRLCPGLYFAGEILDIDGVTGGFNFQSAWTTGWLAGRAMGEVSD